MIRLATYNVEWFTALFDDKARLLADREWSGRYNVTRQAQFEALAHVFRAMNADGLMVVEAPDTLGADRTEKALLAFAKAAGLPLDAVVHGFHSETQQEIAFLYNSNVLEAKHDPWGKPVEDHPAPRFDHQFRMDVDIDGKPEIHRFSKPPLELAIRERKSGRDLRLIGVHVKSKAPHGARDKADAVRISIANRRKQLAQCLWLRERVLQVLGTGADLIVMGDFNDGPGLDVYERLFGKSGVEVVMGDAQEPERFLHDPHVVARTEPRSAWSPATARFFNRDTKRYFNALLDYIMVSNGLMNAQPTWRIWHPFDDGDCYADDPLCEALLAASDHFPVTLDLPDHR